MKPGVKAEFKITSNPSMLKSNHLSYVVSPRPKLRRQCIARFDGECWGNLSREHVISQSVMDVLPQMYFKNMKDEIIPILKSNTGIKLLCRKHNSSISHIDKEAAFFFKILRNMSHSSIDEIEIKDAENNKLCFGERVCGEKLEKWFFKTLLYSVLFEYQAFSFPNFISFFPLAKVDKFSPIYSEKKIDSPFGIYVNVEPSGTGKLFQFEILKVPLEILQENNIYYSYLPYAISIEFFGVNFIGFYNVSELDDQEFLKVINDYYDGKLLAGFRRRPSELSMESKSGTKRWCTLSFNTV